MQIRDSLTVDAAGLTLTRDGYLVGEAKVARAGNVQHYLGWELGLTGDEANKVFGVYRDPDVVFDEKSMMSLAGRPITRGHPSVAVDAKNWRDLAKGQVGGVIKRDGEHVVAPMAIMDHEAAKEVADGARSLSAGYTVSVVKDEGTAPDGTPYQYRQAGDLRFNHVAYLPDNNPRAGNTRIGDADHSRWGYCPNQTQTADERTSPMADALRKMLVDGLQVETTDAGAAAIEKLLGDKQALTSKLSDAEAAHTAALTAKDEEIGALKADLKKVQDAAMKPEDVDRLVADRSALVEVVKAIDSKIEIKGSDADLRRAAVKAKLGDEMVKDASDAEVSGMFKAIAKDVKTADADPFRRVAKDGLHQPATNDATTAHAKMIADMSTAYLGANKGAA